MDVSVIIPVRNAERGLPPLLERLAGQSGQAEYEVIVVDDGSTDDTVAVAEAFRGVWVVRSAVSGGSYAARNLGIAEATAPVLAFTDADCLPGSDWIERGLHASRGGGAELVAGRVAISLATRPSSAALLDYARFLDQGRYVKLGFGATANLWVRRDVFDQVGLFNAHLRSGGDSEFGRRATAAGFRLRYDSELVVSHESRDSVGSVARKSYRIGYGGAQHRTHAQGPLRELAAQPRWSNPREWLPNRSFPGLSRITSAHKVGRGRLLYIQALEYLFVRLAMNIGSVAGTLAERRSA